MFHEEDTHFAVKDLPPPGTPVSSRHFGGGYAKLLGGLAEALATKMQPFF